MAGGVVEVTDHVVMYSGGAGSWAAAKRAAAEHGAENVTLLFSDTGPADRQEHQGEDEDLYRFLTEGAKNIGSELVIVRDGRDIWQVFHDDRFLGNSRLANCSKFLKQAPAHKWLAENASPTATIYVGIDWTEEHRLPAVVKAYAPRPVRAPLCEETLLDKHEVMDMMLEAKIVAPRLYRAPFYFSHNNCGGFCVRAGQKQFVRLLETMPERYAYHEAKEQELREYLGKDVSIMKDRRGGTSKPLTMRDLRLRVEVDASDHDGEIGGCGCFIGEDDE